MSRLFVVRHGNTFETNEQPTRIGCRSDPPLTAVGREQAELIGRQFDQWNIAFSCVLTGSLRRVRQTADGILAHRPRHAAGKQVSWLDEVDHGPDEGMADDDVVARIGAGALERWDRWGEAPKDWLVDADRRLAAWMALYASPPEGDTLLVTSNGSARFALLAMPDATRPAHLKMRTGALGLIAAAVGSQPELCWWDSRPGQADGRSSQLGSVHL